jgi:hypothetical protein
VRDWIALHTGVLDSDTWADLGDHRLAWVVTLILAAQQTPEGEFDSAAKLIRLLTKEDVPYALEAYDEMTRAGCLEDVEGRIQVRGWDRWQRRYRGPSDDPDREALRKREAYWRERAGDLANRLAQGGVSGPSPDISGPSPDTADREEEIREEEKRGEESNARGGDDRDSLDTFYELTMLRPWGKPSGRWLRELEDGYGLERVEAALRAEWTANPEAKSLISRAEARVGREADRTKQAKRKEPPPRRADPVRSEAERAMLREMIQPEVQG